MKIVAGFLIRIVFLGCFIISFSSCGRLDGQTVVEGEVVDRHTGKPVPDADVALYSSNIGSNGYNTVEFDKKADSNGNFSFKFEAESGKSFALRAFTDQGYYTIWEEMIHVETGRNNKKLKLKMQSPAWVRVKLVNVPPKDIIPAIYIQSFKPDEQGQQSVIIKGLKKDTTILRSLDGNTQHIFLVGIDTVGNSTADKMIRSNPVGYFPALDTTDLIIQY